MHRNVWVAMVSEEQRCRVRQENTEMYLWHSVKV